MCLFFLLCLKAVEPSTSKSLTETTPTTEKPIETNKTIFDEYNQTILFSSTKTPKSNKRKTIFDISMEIIDQRIKNINRSVRLNRSVSESDICVDDDIELSSTTIALTTTKSTPQLDKSNGIAYKSQVKTDDKQLSSTDDVVATTKPTKRKLFAPPSYFNYPEIDLTPKKLPIKLNKTPANKTDKKLNSTSKAASTEKRTFADEDDLTEIPCGPSKVKKLKQDDLMLGNINRKPRRSSSSAFQPDRSKIKSLILSKKIDQQTQLATTSALASASATKRKLPFMVYTNMHQEQIKIVKEVGKF